MGTDAVEVLRQPEGGLDPVSDQTVARISEYSESESSPITQLLDQKSSDLKIEK